MFYNRISISVFFLLFLISFTKVFSQTEMVDIKLFNEIKNGTTYFVMSDQKSVNDKAFEEVYTQYWKFSDKIDFINYAEIEKFAKPGNSFFTIEETVTEYSNATSVHVYYQLWTPNKSYFENPGKKVLTKNRQVAAQIALSIIDSRFSGSGSLRKLSYEMEGKVQNWKPGFIKNYIQQLEILQKKGKEGILKSLKQANLLKTNTLYVPAYTVTNYPNQSPTTNLYKSPEQVFKDYNFKHEFISDSTISNKILAADKNFFYLLTVNNILEKKIYVINGLNGEIIYEDGAYSSYLKSGQIKDLNRQVEN